MKFITKLLLTVFLANIITTSNKSLIAMKYQANRAFSRPDLVQAAVDQAFEDIKAETGKPWGFCGQQKYYLMGLDDDLMLQRLFDTDKDDIYIIDVGCGNASWGNHAMKVLLAHENIKKTGKRFHIFSVTGIKECNEKKVHEDNVTHHVFNNFKIENLDEAFLARGFNLKNKVNLMVSRFTLLHPVDPTGTIHRMHSLLTPSNGILLADLFLFKEEPEPKKDSYHALKRHWEIFAASNATLLFQERNNNDNLPSFLLMRNNQKELSIPLEYTGQVYPFSMGHSGLITIFKRKNLQEKNITPLKRTIQRNYYCADDNQQSKDLYAYLENQNLFKKAELSNAEKLLIYLSESIAYTYTSSRETLIALYNLLKVN